MIGFLIYDGKVAGALLVFYLFYRFLLKKETFHRFNRIVLVGTAILSFLLPLCVITIHKPMEMDTLIMEPTAVMPVEIAQIEKNAPWWPEAITILFWTGAALVLVRVAISILSIARIIRQSEVILEEDGCKVIITNRDLASWMRFVILSREDWDGNHDPILTHEKAHISQGHSVDLLLVDIFSALQWFNPAIWMLRADLRELHEYEADNAVLRTGVNIKEYQYLLIRKAVGKSGYSVANSFNHSILRNRITMMSKTKSPLRRRLRVLFLLPLVCLGIGLLARTVYVPQDKDNDIPQKVVTMKVVGLDGQIFIDGKEIPKHELLEYLRSLKGPGQEVILKVDQDINTGQQVMKWLQTRIREAGIMKVQYNAFESNPLYILRHASGKEEEITKEEFSKIDGQRIESFDFLRNSDALEKRYGERAKDGVVLITLKNPQELNEIVVVSYGKKDYTEYVRVVPTEPDTMPTFQGEDMMAFSRWLNTKLVRPKGCEHSGTMKVSFVVGTDGLVKDVTVEESVCEALDEMVVSNIKKSPKWEPATLNGDPIEQSLTIPINFQMRKNSRK